MKLDTLFEANKIAKELEKWNDMDTRLSCGSGFYTFTFEAQKNKTMFSEYKHYVQDEKTIECFKKFVKSMIKQCEDKLEKL